MTSGRQLLTCSCGSCMDMQRSRAMLGLQYVSCVFLVASNAVVSPSLFRTDATVSEQVSGGKFNVKRIRNGITYYCTPLSQTCVTKDSTSSTVCSTQSSPSSASSRPLLLFFSWLGAQPGAVAKYRDLYLDRGMDVLLVQSSVMHFLWPQWGLDYGLEVLKVLEEPQFSGRALLVHASSIGGYTFTQMLTHIALGPKKYARLGQRVTGHIYDSLVAGSLEHMAVGLGKTLVPRLESFIKNTALLYFWLFKSHTVDFYDRGVEVFNNSPITTPALFFFSENDTLCNPVTIEKTMDMWRKRGMAVESRKWKESIHAAHMRCHPQDYICTLEKFLKSLPISSLKTKI